VAFLHTGRPTSWSRTSKVMCVLEIKVIAGLHIRGSLTTVMRNEAAVTGVLYFIE